MCKYLLFLFIVLLYNCVSKPPEITTLRVDLSSPENIHSNQYFESSQFIYLENHPDGLVDRIKRIITYKDRLYLLEEGQKAIMAFDTTGKYLFSVFPSGRGPGEYEQASDFTLDREKKELVLYCDRPYKFMYYTLDGQFKRELSYGGYLIEEITKNDSGQLVCLNSIPDGPHHIISIITTENEQVKNIKQLPMEQYSIHHIVTAGVRLLKSEHINFTRLYDNSIYSVINNEIVKRYHLDFIDHNLPPTLNTPEVDQEEFLQQIRNHFYIFSMTNVKETKNNIFFRTNIPGFFMVDKPTNQVSYSYDVWDHTTGYFYFPNIPVEDEENRLLCCSQSIMSLKKQIKLSPETCPPYFYHRIDSLPEDANPLLIFYKLKE